MLLIVGTNTDRLHNIHLVATRSQLPLRVVNNGPGLLNALAGSRRNVVVFAEEDITDEMTTALEGLRDEPNMPIVIVESEEGGSYDARASLAGFDNVSWLPANTRYERLAQIVTSHRDSMFRVTIEELQGAFVNSEFVIQYQPKVEWVEEDKGWRTAEAEALIRWRHPQYGLLGPRHFLPEAEQYGFMEQVTELVLNTTLAQINKWEGSGLTLNGCVNLSATMLDLNGLATTYTQIALQHKLDCSRIIFELPAGGVLERPRERASAIAKFRNAGFRISLDDFGASSNCMEAFEVLEFDEIKIHASMLRAGQDDDATKKSLAALTGLAHNLGIMVCAEGVETDEMFEFLQEIGCNKMQGYLVSEAVMPEIIQSCYGGDDVADGASVAHSHLM